MMITVSVTKCRYCELYLFKKTNKIYKSLYSQSFNNKGVIELDVSDTFKAEDINPYTKR